MNSSDARSTSGSASGTLVTSVIALVVVLGTCFLLLDRIEKLEHELGTRSNGAAENLQARLATLESNQAALQKELETSAKERGDLLDKIQTAEKITRSPQTLEARFKNLESEQTALRSNLAVTKMDHAETLSGIREDLTGQIRKLETALREDLARVGSKPGVTPREIEQITKSLENLDIRINKAESGQGTLKSDLAKAEVERRRLDERTEALEKSQNAKNKKLLKLESGQGNLDARLGNLQKELTLRLRAIKEKLLRSSYHCSDGNIRGEYFFPFQQHFPYLGISFESLDEEASEDAGLQPGEGIVITQIHSKGPAKDAGLREGDVLLRVNGTAINRCGLPGECLVGDQWIKRTNLPNYVNTCLPGDTVEVEFIQDGTTRKAKVQLTCRLDHDACAFYNAPPAK